MFAILNYIMFTIPFWPDVKTVKKDNFIEKALYCIWLLICYIYATFENVNIII